VLEELEEAKFPLGKNIRKTIRNFDKTVNYAFVYYTINFVFEQKKKKKKENITLNKNIKLVLSGLILGKPWHSWAVYSIPFGASC